MWHSILLGWAIFLKVEGGFNYSREMGPNTSLEWVRMSRLILYFLHSTDLCKSNVTETELHRIPV